MKTSIVNPTTTRRVVLTILAVVTLFGLAWQSVNAQQLGTDGSRRTGVWKTYRYVDGLADNTVTAILEAKDGAIWFGTFGGVSRFDGKNWRTYTVRHGLADNTIHALLQDRTGAIWAATHNGVSRLDGEEWHSYTKADGLIDDDVNTLIEDRSGVIWAGTWEGISRFDGKTWRIFDQPKVHRRIRAVTAIMEDQSGAVWVGGLGGVHRYERVEGENYTRTKHIPIPRVTAIMQDAEGAIWVGSIGRGVAQFDGESGTLYTEQGIEPIRGSRDNPSDQSVRPNRTGENPQSGRSERRRRFRGRRQLFGWQEAPEAAATQTQNSESTDALADNTVLALLQDDAGELWFGTEDGGVSWYDGSQWQAYTTADGLGSNTIYAILQDKEGAIWFGTLGGGVSRLDRSSWIAYTQREGLSSNKVSRILQDEQGHMWFGTLGGSISRYDGENWQTYTSRNPLEFNPVSVIFGDKAGAMWVGRHRGGVSRFDGQEWKIYSRRYGFGVNGVSDIFQDREGAMWFATGSPMQPGDGVKWFDGENWKTFTQEDGLASNTVSSIFQDREGAIWFGTGNQSERGRGVSRYHGERWETYTQAGYTVLSVFEDREGAMWFGTDGNGVSWYDGAGWARYTTQDGLGSNHVSDILQDTEGVMWFGTTNGGLSRYDGRTFQTIDSRDGLVNDTVTCLYIDRSGSVWFGTLGGGAIRFMHPKKVQPPVAITRVEADGQSYKPDKPIKLPANVKQVVFRFHATSFRTRPGGMRYTYQLIGHDADWQTPTEREEKDYLNLEPGDYTFQVQAIDRDLNYSDFTSVRITVPIAFYKTAGFLVPVGSVGVLLLGTLVALTTAFINHRRRISEYQQAVRQELQDARDVQKSLLPERPPEIEEFDIAGICKPATEVGGDYFTYLWLDDQNTQFGIVLIDVAGHGMKAAATTFLANGMLQSEIQHGQSPDKTMEKMHHALKGVLPRRTFVALSFALLDLEDKTLTHFNAGLPEPICLRDGKVVDLEFHNGVPLGSLTASKYVGTRFSLRAGDVLLFFSDGLPEARDAQEQLYEETRMVPLLESLAGQNLSAQAWVEAILAEVEEFTRPAEPTDDMTLVVAKVL